MSGLTDVTLLGNGATLLLANLTGGFTLSNINGLAVRDLTIDMRRLPYTYGVVQAVDSGAGVVTIDAGSMYPPPQSADQSWLLEVQVRCDGVW
jgi:hypothetical protein